MSSPPSVPNSYCGSDTFRKDSVGWSSSLKAPDRPRYEAPEEFDVRQPIRPIKVLDVEAGEDDVARELDQLLSVGAGRRRRREQQESAHRRRFVVGRRRDDAAGARGIGQPAGRDSRPQGHGAPALVTVTEILQKQAL
jgi:hypothetical protein